MYGGINTRVSILRIAAHVTSLCIRTTNGLFDKFNMPACHTRERVSLQMDGNVYPSVSNIH